MLTPATRNSQPFRFCGTRTAKTIPMTGTAMFAIAFAMPATVHERRSAGMIAFRSTNISTPVARSNTTEAAPIDQASFLSVDVFKRLTTRPSCATTQPEGRAPPSRSPVVATSR